jgi:ferredoxin
MYTDANLYYFSGTGNTQALARFAASALEERGISATTTSVVGLQNIKPASLLGILFPVYCFGAPRIVNRLLRRLPNGEGRAAFVIANAAETPGSAASDVAQVLQSKGYKVVLADWVRMPSNYILGGAAVTDEEAVSIISAAETRMRSLVAEMAGGDKAIERPWRPLHRLAYKAFLRGLNYMARFYKVTDKCTSCGACVEFCPTGTITLGVGDKPVWGKGCEHCMRCVNLCPVAAIEVGSLTRGKRRYTYWSGKL